MEVNMTPFDLIFLLIGAAGVGSFIYSRKKGSEVVKENEETQSSTKRTAQAVQGVPVQPQQIQSKPDLSNHHIILEAQTKAKEMLLEAKDEALRVKRQA
ncbi:hypothetical protein HY419_00015, partial [candidate division WWE3 bacterium]|nr:hypothetical protein [candidate division WWE3 bacterium]